MQGYPCCVNPVPYIQSHAASPATGRPDPAQQGHGQAVCPEASAALTFSSALSLLDSLVFTCHFFKICCLKVKISVKPKNVLKFAENATNPQLDLFRVIPSIDVTSAPEKCRRSINKRFKLLCKISPRKVFKGWCKMGSKF